jgi:proline iminopeptidase
MTHMNRRGLLAASGALALSACAPAAKPPAKPAVTEGMAQVPGGKVWWRKVGEGDRAPLLTLHGGPGAGHDYLEPLAALADQRPVIFYDQLGCGRSEKPADNSLWTIYRFAAEIDALRTALKLDRVCILGHSWGGFLAVDYMTDRAPKGVEALVLASGSASTPQATRGIQGLVDAMPNGAGARIHALEKAGQMQSKEYQDLVGQFYALHLFRGDPNNPLLEATNKNVASTPVYPIMNGPNEFTITGTIKDWDRTAQLGKIDCPTLITTGEFDEVTLDCAQTLNQGIKGSRLEVLKGASHLYMLEQPDAYNALIRSFLADKA